VRHLARRPVDRAAVIRRGIAELGDRYRAEVWAWWNNNAGIWEVDFERLDGGPTADEFKAAIAQHSSLRDHHQAIAVATEAGAALRWARAMRLPGAAVILDTETTDLEGYVVEIAVLDAATGDVLLDTLVNPGCPVQPAARWVCRLKRRRASAAVRGIRSRPVWSVMDGGGAYVRGGAKRCPQPSGPLFPRGRARRTWPRRRGTRGRAWTR
jgi:hypothetical protein